MIRVAALFAGIGGIELGLQRALGQEFQTVLMCESWDAAQHVLTSRFPEIDLHPDVRTLSRIPAGEDDDVVVRHDAFVGECSKLPIPGPHRRGKAR